jgi:hypothetical protein
MNHDSTLTGIVTLLLFSLCFAATGLNCAEADLVPHPYVMRHQKDFASQLGQFGESVVNAAIRARGYEVIDGNIDGRGIDLIAAKRNPSGALVDLRFIEVKTRQGVPNFQLATTTDGRQLADDWILPRLKRIADDHLDAGSRKFSEDAIAFLELRPNAIRRELHGVAVEADRYLVMSVDPTGRVMGVVHEEPLTKVLESIARDGESSEVRKQAIQHRSQYERMQSTVRSKTSNKYAETHSRGVRTLASKQGLIIGQESRMPAMSVIAKNSTSPTSWAKHFASRPGVLASGVTFVVDEVDDAWEYYEGSISSADFVRRSEQNGVKAAIVGMATQIVYFLTPTPSGLVVAAVGWIVYVAVDYAIAAYDSAYLPSVATASDLRGIIPDSAINTPMIEDVASGRMRVKSLEEMILSR